MFLGLFHCVVYENRLLYSISKFIYVESIAWFSQGNWMCLVITCFCGLSFLVLWCIGFKFVWDFICFCHLYETGIERIVFTLVQNLWITSTLLPMAFRYSQHTGWWSHYNRFVTILGQGLYHLGKLVRVQSNKNPFWKRSCWLVWFVRYRSLCCYFLVKKLLFD